MSSSMIAMSQHESFDWLAQIGNRLTRIGRPHQSRRSETPPAPDPSDPPLEVYRVGPRRGFGPLVRARYEVFRRSDIGETMILSGVFSNHVKALEAARRVIAEESESANLDSPS